MIGAKIIKSGGAEPSDFEKQIGQALLELEMNSDLKQQLRELYITRAREVEFSGKKVCSNASSHHHQKLMKSFPFRPSLFTFQFQSKRLSRKSKRVLFVNWKRNSRVVMLCSAPSVRSFPNRSVVVQILTSRSVHVAVP